MDKRSSHKSLLHRIYGDLRMSWARVILLAIFSAVLTAVFLIVPAFDNTSFERMGVYLEAWFFFAILIMANCKSPKESALKTFVFFLISQPLIYLFQVPFYELGWQIFRFYKYWAILTVLTLPMAYIGWYITKKTWLSLLVLSPVLAFMGITAYQSGIFCLHHFPLRLVTSLFCLFQILIYVTVFCSDAKKRALGLLVPVIAVIIYTFAAPKFEVNTTLFLPEDTVLSESAEVIMEETSGITVTIERTGEDSMVRIHAAETGTADFTIQDGDTAYSYTVRVWEDDAGHPMVDLDER